MSSLNRKMRRKLGDRIKATDIPQSYIISPNRYERIKEEARGEADAEYKNKLIPVVRDAMIDMQERLDKENMVIACKIIFEHYGKLKNKTDRVRNFIDLHNAEMAEWEKLPIKDRIDKLDKEVALLEERVGDSLKWKWKWSGGGTDGEASD